MLTLTKTDEENADEGDSTPVGANTSYYEFLGIAQSATPDELKKAYQVCYSNFHNL